MIPLIKDYNNVTLHRNITSREPNNPSVLLHQYINGCHMHGLAYDIVGCGIKQISSIMNLQQFTWHIELTTIHMAHDVLDILIMTKKIFTFCMLQLAQLVMIKSIIKNKHYKLILLKLYHYLCLF